ESGLVCLHADALRDVLNGVNAPSHPGVCVQDRAIERAPILSLKTAVWPAKVVSLHGHGIGSAGPQHTVQGSPKVGDPACARIVRVIGEDLEQLAADDGLSLG